MSKLDFSTKCEILGWLYATYKNETSWQPFCRTQDIGLPMAYLIVQDLVEPTDEGAGYIEDTWLAYCTFLDIDPNEEYETLEETFLASPNVTMKED